VRGNFPDTEGSLAMYALVLLADGVPSTHCSHVCGKKTYVESPVLIQLQMNL
jgi:hypothetical protein